MSEDRTGETKDARSFEERVFARFDVVEIRIGKLEERTYDTKPIWEQALSAILEIRGELKSINARLDGMDQRFEKIDERFEKIDQRFEKILQRFDKQDNDAEDSFRSIKLKLDIFNENLMELRANHRYFERKLAKIEAKVFPEEPN
jgi:chromosome segregation ATPase